MAIDFPSSPTNGQTFTDGDKTWVYSTTVGAWSLQTQTATGATGPAGFIAQTTSPANTSLLWLDTDEPAAQTNNYTPAVSYITGNYYQPPSSGQYASTLAVPVNTTYYQPFYVTENKTFDRISIVSGSTFSGSGTVRLGIYNNSGFQPSTVFLDAGTVAVSAIDTAYSITISSALSVGWYWLAFNSTSVAATNTFRYKTAMGFHPYNIGTAALQNNAYVGYSQSVNATSGFSTATSLGFFYQGPVIALRST